MAGFNLAVPVGSALGFLVGGTVVGASPGTGGTAFWATFSGLILGIICFAMKEKPRPPLTESEKARPSYCGRGPRPGGGTSSFTLCCLGMTAVTFVTGGVAAWAPTYIYQRETRFVVTDEALKDKVLEKTAGGGGRAAAAARTTAR